MENKKTFLTEQVLGTLDLVTESVETKSGKYLGRLKGICADFSTPTRNGRKYPKKLWENVFNSALFKEQFNNKCIYGELNHPTDRLETDLTKIAVNLSDIQMQEDGKIIGTFDILNTPSGQILKAVCDYGSKLGVSSRGNGDIVDGPDGEPTVREDTYEFVAFDVVALPAVETARPNVVESLERQGKVKTLKESIEQSIDTATTKGELLLIKDIIESIELPERETIVESLNNKLGNMEGGTTTSKLLDDFQDTAMQLEKVKEENAQLKESISAGTTREMSLKEELEKVKSALKVLEANSRKTQVLEKLTKSKLEVSNKIVNENLETTNRNLITDNKVLKSSNETLLSEQKVLNEKIREKESLVENLNEKVKSLEEQLDTSIKTRSQDVDVLKSNLKTVKENLETEVKSKDAQISELTEKLSKKTNDFETISNLYIKQKCTVNGLNENTIKTQLGESYSSQDVIKLVDEASDYKFRISTLPFQVGSISARVVKEEFINETPKRKDDEDLSSLNRMLNINKKK